MNENILAVDDDETTCDLIRAALTRRGHAVVTQRSPRQALSQMSLQDFDLVLTELDMTEMSGGTFIERVRGLRPDVPVVIVSGQATLAGAIAAMRAGAFDFVAKPVDEDLLGLAVARALAPAPLRERLTRLRAAVTSEGAPGIVGRSAVMMRMFDLVARIAPSDASVLIHGETGTGKELVARAIHAASGRTGPFVAINCAAVPASLLESELFGHARGAFTDARTERMGLFLQATKGTLFLDEVGELPLEMQPKLLRALQERKVRPVGANVETAFDARLVCATNRDLETEIDAKRFREDLYYRVNVVQVDLPPLRHRGEDVVEIATLFLERLAVRNGKDTLSLSHAAAEKLASYDWPGNVRELENCLERAVALTRNEEVDLRDLPVRAQRHRAEPFALAVEEPDEILSMADVERRYIVRTMSLVGGNKTRAAQLLGFDRRTLYRKLEGYGPEDN